MFSSGRLTYSISTRVWRPNSSWRGHGQKEELIGPEHIGHLAGKNCEVELDLVRGDIANGSCS